MVRRGLALLLFWVMGVKAVKTVKASAEFSWPWKELLADDPGYPQVPRRDTRYGK